MRRLAESLRDAWLYVARLFRSGWKFIALTTLVLSLVLMPLLLFLPTLYVRDVTVTVTPSLTELQRRLGQVEPVSGQQIGNAAATLLRQGKAFDDEVLIDPVYDEARGHIEVHLESEDEPLMRSMDSRIVELLETTYQRSYERDLTPATETVLRSLDGEISYSEEALANIERERDEALGSGEQGEVERLDAERAAVTTNLDALAQSRSYFAGALEDMPAIADEAVTARVSEETPVRSKSSRASAIAAAFLLSVVVAIAGALRAGHPRGK